MKLFGIGGNKDELPREKGKERSNKKEEKEDDLTDIKPIIQDNIPKEEDDNTSHETAEEEKEEETITEDDNSDYIDPEDLSYTDYEDIVDTIENNGWTRASSSGLCSITHHDYETVFSKLVKKDFRESVLEIKCPEGKIIAICGFNHDDIDRERFLSPNLCSRPHFVTLRCTDCINSEISSTTIINITKTNENGEVELLYQEFYGDLSPINDGKLKKKSERYYFAETIILQKGEKLIFQVLGPDKDISKIDFLMMSDVFIKDD